MPLTWEHEDAALQKGHTCLIGVDEVGRGPWAGPVVAGAACFLERDLHPALTDSKKLTPKKRAEIEIWLQSRPGLAWSIAEASEEEIDRFNIREATFLAMNRAVAHLLSELKTLNLKLKTPYLLIDGNALPTREWPGQAIVKGDAKSPSIAAASILAKEYRDRLMTRHAEEFPHYGFDAHMGYGTAQHQEALRKHGPCRLHRRSFAPVRAALGSAL
jgi:ribonuclease HII